MTGQWNLLRAYTYLVFDRPKLVEIVGNALVSEDTDAVEIPVTEEKMPMLTKERLKNFNTVLGVYTTNFGESPNRSRNIELAAEAIRGSVVGPGTVFSYNDATGERSPDKGILGSACHCEWKTAARLWRRRVPGEHNTF